VGETDFGTVDHAIAGGFYEGKVLCILRIEDDASDGFLCISQYSYAIAPLGFLMLTVSPSMADGKVLGHEGLCSIVGRGSGGEDGGSLGRDGMVNESSCMSRYGKTDSVE
jgi:hypothetical protein